MSSEILEFEFPGGYRNLKWLAENVFDVQPDTVKSWIEHYEIPHRRLKSLYLVRPQDIVDYAEKFYEQEKSE